MHQSVGPINATLLVETYEGFGDRLLELIVHGEPEAVPIQRAPNHPELMKDLGAVLFLPIPDVLQEFFAP